MKPLITTLLRWCAWLSTFVNFAPRRHTSSPTGEAVQHPAPNCKGAHSTNSRQAPSDHQSRGYYRRMPSLAQVHVADDKIIVCFPMPQAQCENARICATAHSITLESSHTLVHTVASDDGCYRPSALLRLRIRHRQRLPARVDANRGRAIWDEHNAQVVVSLPRMRAA